MTNEEFIKELIDAEYIMPESVVPHAQKLVAVAEAAKMLFGELYKRDGSLLSPINRKIIECRKNDPLVRALENLERE